MSEITLPMPPAMIARAIQVASDPVCTVADLCEVIKRNPVLSAQLLKSVNSAYYALRRKISAIDRAIAFMGVRAVRNLLLCFGVRELAPATSDYPITLFWECSLRRAISAVCIAKRLGLRDADNILTLGLCQDLGLLALVTERKALAPALRAVARKAADERLRTELAHGVSHVDIGAALFEQWSFPEEITQAIRFHHEPEKAPEAVRVQSKIAFVSESIADLMEVDDKKLSLELAMRLLDEIGIGSEKLSEILNEVSQEVTKAAEMLEIKVGVQPSYQEIIQAASAGLLALNMSYESLTAELQESLRQQEKMARRLEDLNAELERQAMTDKLTGLPNRRAFDESLEKEISRAGRINTPCALILMDIDHFKKFNDAHGHLVGDHVLQSVGAAIRQAVRTCDFPARYGGEEFAVILPHTPIEGAAVAAERIRETIADIAVENEGEPLCVTVSLGVTVIDKPTQSRAGVLAIRRADDALYEAKAGGRNCVRTI